MYCSAEIQQLLQLRRPFVVAERVFRDEARAICSAFANKDGRRGRALFRKFEAGDELPPELALTLSLIAAELERLASSPSLKHIDDALALAGNKYIDRREAEKRLGCAFQGLWKEAREIAEFGALSFRYRDAGEVVYFHEDQIKRAFEIMEARRVAKRPSIRIAYSRKARKPGSGYNGLKPSEYMSTFRLIKALGMKEKAFQNVRNRRGKYRDLPFWPEPVIEKGNVHYYAVADVNRFIAWLALERERVADGTYTSRQEAKKRLGCAKRFFEGLRVAFRDPRSQSHYFLTADIERMKAERDQTLRLGVRAHGL